jgi:hypothetical protein
MEEGRGECSFTGDGQNVMWEKEGFNLEGIAPFQLHFLNIET